MNKEEVKEENIKECMDLVKYVIKQQGLHSLNKPIDCIEKYIVSIERKIFGLEETNRNLQYKLGKIGDYLISAYGKGRRR